MATLLQVYRAACTHASVEPPLSVADNDTPTGYACNVYFLPLYRAFLELGDWNWAIRREVVFARAAVEAGSDDNLDDDGYVVLDTEDLPDYSYKYQIPYDYYGYGTVPFSLDPDVDRSSVRVLGIIREEDTGNDPDGDPETTSESQTQWTEEGEYLYTDYSRTDRPVITDPARSSWIPSLVLRFVATVDIRFAKGPFVEALIAFLGAKLAWKFRRQATPVQEMFAYGQAQLQLALQTLPEPVDYRAITFTNVEDVPASPQTGR